MRTRRFNQTSALYITCHLTPASLCRCETIKWGSEDARTPGDTRQTRSVVLLQLHFLRENSVNGQNVTVTVNSASGENLKNCPICTKNKLLLFFEVIVHVYKYIYR